MDDYGEIALIDAYTTFLVAGFRFDLSAEDVIEFCGRRKGVNAHLNSYVDDPGRPEGRLQLPGPLK
jgi:hypothetical protein